jgi:4'-phosphopantetheinyl transferase
MSAGANMTNGSAPSPFRSQAHPRLSLWWAPLDIPAASRASLADYLSPEEHKRANEYRFPIDRDRFVAGRGWLRLLLADEAGCTAQEVRFVTDEDGKPEIESSDLKFSASRSAGLALYATSWTTEVGVDVEAIRTTADVDLDDMATKFFSVAERRALGALPPPQRLAASFQCWTCKEAYVKAIGSGLSFPTQTVQVWSDDARQVTVSGWTIHQIEVAPGFAAAVAGKGLEGWIPTVPRRITSPDSDPSPAIIGP